MDFCQEILSKHLHQEINISEIELGKLLDSICYKALKEIKEIIEDDSLDDAECFMKIERIVCLLEKLGSNGGSRHDFG